MKAFVFILLVLVSSCDYISCPEWYRRNEKNHAYDGKVVKKFFDSSERGQPRVVLDDGQKYLLDNIKIFNKIEVGDIILKKAGTLQYLLIQGSDTTIFYQQCDGDDIKR